MQIWICKNDWSTWDDSHVNQYKIHFFFTKYLQKLTGSLKHLHQYIMRFITYAEINWEKWIGDKKYNYTVLGFLYYMWIVWYHLKIDCDKLKVYTIKPKAITKVTTKIIANREKNRTIKSI